MEWSTYQEQIYAFVEDAKGGNGIVQAVAGSGKTTTLVECGSRSAGNGYFVAFNRHIADELGRRLPKRVKASTIHQMGYATLMKSRYKFDVKEYKYRDLCQAYLQVRHPGADKADLARMLDVLEPLVTMARLTLTDPQDPAALMQMALEYDLDIGTAQTWDVASAYVPAILDLGRRVAKGPTNVMRAIESGGTVEVEGEPGPGGVIDFGDMVWLPTVEDLYPHQRPYVMIDEAQDLNRAQLELVLRAVEPGGRTLAVGDAGQAIYGWAGADFHSMDRIAQRTGARSMPLSICYRCPASHVALAATVHPQIEPRPNAPEGVIEGNVPEEDAVRRMTPGDLVISRVNAPLVPMAYEMIRMGVPARVRGRDIGKGLCALVHRVAEQAGCTLRDFPRWVEHYREAQEAEVIRRGKEGVEMALVSLRDRCETLVAIYESLKPPTLERFVAAVQELFSDEAQGVVWLSTIHRAKGDEAERVYILRPDLLPHPRARTPQQQEQEQNLRYVAFTRAKEALSFVGGPAPRG